MVVKTRHGWVNNLRAYCVTRRPLGERYLRRLSSRQSKFVRGPKHLRTDRAWTEQHPRVDPCLLLEQGILAHDVGLVRRSARVAMTTRRLRASPK
jgi:hypothetical protein